MHGCMYVSMGVCECIRMNRIRIGENNSEKSLIKSEFLYNAKFV